MEQTQAWILDRCERMEKELAESRRENQEIKARLALLDLGEGEVASSASEGFILI